jgi:hypothetical protein
MWPFEAVAGRCFQRPGMAGVPAAAPGGRGSTGPWVFRGSRDGSGWLAGGEGLQAGDRGSDLRGPGPAGCEAQPRPAAATDDAAQRAWPSGADRVIRTSRRISAQPRDARDAHAAPAAMAALPGRRRSWPGLWLTHRPRHPICQRLPAGQNAGPQAPLARLVPFGRILTTQPIAGADLEAHRANAVRPAVLVSHVPVMASWSRSETVVRQSRTSILRWPSTKPAAEPIRTERRVGERPPQAS